MKPNLLLIYCFCGLRRDMHPYFCEIGSPTINHISVAAYYFKVYRPKHEAPVDDEDEYEYDESDPYGDYEQEDETEYGEETEGEE